MDDDKQFDMGFDDLPVNESVSDEFEQDPSDFETEETEESTNETVETVEEVKETTEPQKIKVKFDREERELSVEEASLLAQKGMNYERAVARAAQEARDAYIAEQGYEWQGKPITNEAEYKQAIAEKEMMDKYKDLPPELMQEIVESRRDREERAKEKQAKETEAKQQGDYNDFFQYFESVNERRFDPKTDTLPQEVIEAANNGQPLKYAYMEHFTKQLRNSLKVSKQNETNKQKAPVGSITSHGNNAKEPIDPFLEGWDS